jgi:hypothetical protein
VLEGLTPVLSSDAKIEENGVLLLTGQYLTKPSQVNFEQKYVYEELSWKLIGFNIEARLDASGKLLFERHQPLSQGAQ